MVRAAFLKRPENTPNLGANPRFRFETGHIYGSTDLAFIKMGVESISSLLFT